MVTRLTSRRRAMQTQASRPMRPERVVAHLEERGVRPSELPHERSLNSVKD